MTNFIRKNMAAVVTVTLVILLMELTVRVAHISNFVFPTPSSIVAAWWDERFEILKHLSITTLEAVGGFIIGSVTAIVISCLFVRFQLLEKAFLPVAILFQTLPIIVISPILVILLGNGLSPKIFVSALITFFPVLVNMSKGLKEVDANLSDLFFILDAKWFQTLWKLRFPSSLPLLFPALRIASANCFIGAIIGEWISADSGIGYWILIRMYQLKIESMYAGVLSGSLAAMVLYSIVSLAEYHLLPWKRENFIKNGGS